MEFAVFTTSTDWIEAAYRIADEQAYAAAMDRHGITSEILGDILAAEAVGANSSGISLATAEMIAVSTDASLRDVLLVRAGLFHSGLLAKIHTPASAVKLQVPYHYDRP